MQVLPDFEVSANAAVWALYPSAKHVLPRMRVLLDFLGDWFREARGEERPVKPAAVATTTPRSNGKSAAGEAVRLRAG